MKKLWMALLIGALLTTGALADGVSFNGTVQARETQAVCAPIGGTVADVCVSVGENVAAGDVIAVLETEKVYASESGTITGIFAQPGDSAETVSQRYGAVMYIEQSGKYTIAASTANAYNTTATKFVHAGETVYLSCYSDGKHSGSGVITQISGTDYTVDVTEGEFLVGETVNVYRGDAAKAVNRIGRGTISRKNPVAVTGEGSVVSLAVADGDTVERGDLLFETLKGSFDGMYMCGNEILAEADGTIAKLNIERGGNIEKGNVAAVIYPAGKMEIAGSVSQYDLSELAVGDSVNIELLWNQDAEVCYTGKIRMISAVADTSEGAAGQDTEDTNYTVYVDFTPDASTRYGMSAIVSTDDSEEEAAYEAD